MSQSWSSRASASGNWILVINVLKWFQVMFLVNSPQLIWDLYNINQCKGIRAIINKPAFSFLLSSELVQSFPRCASKLRWPIKHFFVQSHRHNCCEINRNSTIQFLPSHFLSISSIKSTKKYFTNVIGITPCIGSSLQWFKTSWILDKNIPLSHELRSEWASERTSAAKRAVRRKRTSERCERTSERMNEWPSTNVKKFCQITVQFRF